MCAQPTWSTCSLSSTSTTSTSRRLLSEFTQEHVANRRKLLADPSDKGSVAAAKESLQGTRRIAMSMVAMTRASLTVAEVQRTTECKRLPAAKYLHETACRSLPA